MSRNSSATQGPGALIGLEGILHAQIVTKRVIGTSYLPKITLCDLNITRSGLFSMYRMGNE
jgi:hypothetical protein